MDVEEEEQVAPERTGEASLVTRVTPSAIGEEEVEAEEVEDGTEEHPLTLEAAVTLVEEAVVAMADEEEAAEEMEDETSEEAEEVDSIGGATGVIPVTTPARVATRCRN